MRQDGGSVFREWECGPEVREGIVPSRKPGIPMNRVLGVRVGVCREKDCVRGLGTGLQWVFISHEHLL